MNDYINKLLYTNTYNYAKYCHTHTNHMYDNEPYFYAHVVPVVREAERYQHLVDDEHRLNFLCGAMVHDVIEDTRESYNDVLQNTNKEVADLAYALTNEKGKNRKERANDKYYNEMKKVPYAVLIKVCDRLANFKYSLAHRSGMAEMYRKENKQFIEMLYDERFKEAFDELKELGENK